MQRLWKKTIGIAGLILGVTSFGFTTGISYAVPTVPQELLLNGNFATGNLNDWTKRVDGGIPLSEISLINMIDTTPVTGSVSVRTDPHTDNYFVRGGIPEGKNGNQIPGYRLIESNTFLIPTQATYTTVSFWWRMQTWDKRFYDRTWGIIRKADNTEVDVVCGRYGGTTQGNFTDTGWIECVKDYTTSTLIPGDSYYLRLTLLAADGTRTLDYPSWAYVDDASVKSYVPAPVPESSTFTLLGMAICGLGIIYGLNLRKKINTLKGDSL